MTVKGKHVPVKLALTCDDFAAQYCDLLSLPEIFGSLVCCGVRISCSMPPACILGEVYSYQLTASGGEQPYTFSSSTLPSGLTLNGSTGEVTGTPNLDQQVISVDFQVEDSEGQTGTCSATFYVSAALNITTLTIPNGSTGVAYSEQLAADGGVLPLTWARAAGALPAGLAIDSSGLISGTPTEFGDFAFVARATDAGVQTDLQAYALVVADLTPPQFVSASIDSTGTQLTVIFDRPVTGTELFELYVDDSLWPITGASNNGNEIVFTLTPGMYAGLTPTIDYIPGDVQSTVGTPLEAFVDKPVSNNSLATTPPETPPVIDPYRFYLCMDGVDTRIEVPWQPDPTKDTVISWVYRTTRIPPSGSFQTIIGCDANFQFSNNNNNGNSLVRVGIFGENGNKSPLGPIEVDKWYSSSISYPADSLNTSFTCTLRKNQVPLLTNMGGTLPSNDLQIGWRAGGGPYKFEGIIAGVTVFEDGVLTHNWKIDEGSGTDILDSVGTANGTIIDLGTGSWCQIPDTFPPQLQTAYAYTVDSKIELTFDENIIGDPTLGFSVTLNGGSASITGGTIVDNVISATLLGTITSSDIVAVAYAESLGNITDEAGNPLESFSVIAQVIVEVPIEPIFERDYAALPSLGADATYARESEATVVDHEGIVRNVLSGEARFNGGRRVYNLFTDTTTTLASGSATTAVTVTVGTYVFSMGAGSGTATFSGTATGSSGTLNANASSRTAKALTITGAGTIIVTASVADLATIMLENTTGQTSPTIPSEYVSVGVGTGNELLPGDWATPASWTLNPFYNTDGAIEFTGGRIRVSNTGGADPTTGLYYYQELSLTKGQLYRVFGSRFAGTNGYCTLFVRDDLSSGTQYESGKSKFVNSDPDDFTFRYTGSTGTAYLQIGLFYDTASYAEFENIGLEKVDTQANVDGVKYFATANGNTVDASGIVTEATGAALSPAPALLMEPAATNLVTHSKEIDNAAWVDSGAPSVTADAAIAPDGTTTADEIGYTANAWDGKKDSIAVSNATVYTCSAYFKAGSTAGTTWFGLHNGSDWDGYVEFVWTAGVPGSFTTSGAGVGAYTSESVGSGWYRISVVVTTSVATENLMFHVDRTSTANASIYFWGAQLELGSVATSPIPTAGAEKARAVDTLSYPLVTPQTEGTLVAECTAYHDSVQGSSRWLTFGDVALGVYQNTAAGRWRIRDTAGNFAQISSDSYAAGENYVLAGTWSTPNGLSVYSQNGADAWQAVNSPTYGGSMSTEDLLTLGSEITVPINYRAAYVYSFEKTQQAIEDDHS